MTVIYQTTITRIGQSAADALSDQMLITFREGAPADIEEFCFFPGSYNHLRAPGTG
ncbi:PTS glucitol/sorbitol transporter subunit IIA, partial [Enterobacter hormaechei]